MYPSSTLCRSQEEFHLQRAAAATLENVRAISTGAAAAWRLEAIAAEKREARSARTRAIAESMAAGKHSASEAGRQLSDHSRSGFELAGNT